MAIEAGDFKTGLTLIVDGDPWQVLDFQHVKPGKGAALLRTKMNNLKMGVTQERNFNANVKFEQANIEKKNVTFSYESDGVYYFMDGETYEMYELTEEQIGFNKYFIIDGLEVQLVMFEGSVLTISVPASVDLVIAETSPAIKGAPSTQTKDAVTETGLTIRVPQFIEQGEKVSVTTADGKYSSRA